MDIEVEKEIKKISREADELKEKLKMLQTQEQGLMQSLFEKQSVINWLKSLNQHKKEEA